MAPTLHNGDSVRVVAGASPRSGDIVVAQSENGLLVHRAICRIGDRLVLGGDNSTGLDEPVPLDAVLGRVTAVEALHGRSRRLDSGCARAVGLVTAGYGRCRGALRRGPRPKAIPAAALALDRTAFPRMSPEDEFVLNVARPKLPDDAVARGRVLIERGLDWDEVIRRAWLGQLGPLVYSGVRQLGDDTGIPAPTLDGLRSLYAASWARSRMLRSLLAQTLERLEREGIEALGHKGVALAATVYSDPALNISGDIDLSVRDSERSRAERATHEIRQPLAEKYPTRRELDGYHIELDGTAHHDLDPALFGSGRWQARSFDWEAIWERAHSVSIDGESMLVPCPDDLVMTLVANSIRRGFTPVRLVAGIAATIAHYATAIDWRRVHGELRRTGLDRRSWIALGLAADWFGADVPAGLLEPPQGLHPASYEGIMIEWKRRRPFTRLPTRVLWAGSAPRAAGLASRMALRPLTRRALGMAPGGRRDSRP